MMKSNLQPMEKIAVSDLTALITLVFMLLNVRKNVLPRL